jgi:hypothetical protein
LWKRSLMSAKGLLAEACQRRPLGLTKLTRDEMRLAGYSNNTAKTSMSALASSIRQDEFGKCFMVTVLTLASSSEASRSPAECNCYR